MEEIKNEQMAVDNTAENIPNTANGTAVQKEEVAKDLGKFKSVDALYSAYLSLEAEFTRRSQKLKELEEGSKAAQPSPKTSEELAKIALSDDEVKNAVIVEYIKSVAEKKGVPLLVGGEAVAAPSTKPKSVKDAGRLATEFLNS